MRRPRHSDVGRIVVRLAPTVGRSTYRYEVDVLEFDGCAEIINEGVGFQFWFDDHIDLELAGDYVVEGITGHYHRGNWSFGEDDDETWSFRLVRRANPEDVDHLVG